MVFQKVKKLLYRYEISMAEKKDIISMKDVTKVFVNGEVVTPALSGVTFHIHEGEFVALMGPSGSGKSTLMHIMGFLDHLTEGEYLYRGKDVANLDDDELALMRRDQVGFVFQFFNLLPNSSVMENIILPMIYAQVPMSKREAKAKKAIKQVGLEHRLHHLSNQLSGGERQRVAMARAIVNEPSVIYADEPTGNLDTKSGEMVLKVLQDLNKAGHTIVMVTHEEEAAQYAKRIIKMRDGVIVSDTHNHNQREGTYRK